MELGFLHHLVNQPAWLILLTSLGFLSLARSTIALLRWSHAFLLRPAKDLKRRYGSWAVVTGATDGIGKAVAFELARNGLHLILIGRNPDKLQEVSAAIGRGSTATQIKSVVIDLSSGNTRDGIGRLREAMEGLDVGVLVNNAGVSERCAMMFHEVEVERWVKIVRVNAEALTEVTRAVLPGMVERRRGAIVNVGSGSAIVVPSFPLFAVYTGTKAYVDQLSRSLHVEYKDSGIDVQCQHPLYVATKMVSKVAKVKWYNPFVASPDVYARATVRWIGYEPRCMPYWPHFLQWFIAGLMPNFINDEFCLRINMSQRKALKRR